MPALTEDDVTVTVLSRRIEGSRRRHQVKIQFGDGVKTYPEMGGVPLPSISNFAFVFKLDYLVLFGQHDTNGLLWRFDAENTSLRGIWPTGGSGSAPTAAATAPRTIVSEPGTIGGSWVDHVHDLQPGAGREFVEATTVIPATTLYAEAVGY